jgi:tetratricopeptide (TPR) repeat protein
MRFPTAVCCLVFGAALFGAAPLGAQDKIVTRTETLTGEIVGVEADGSPRLKVGSGVQKVNRADVLSIEMRVPADLVKARQSLEAGDWAAVETAVAGIASQYKGLPAAPAVEAIGLLADAQLAQKKLDAARATYQALGTAYAGTAYADKAVVGLARLAIAEGGNVKLLEAGKRLEPILNASTSTLLPDAARQRVFADAWFAQGQLLEARGEKVGALEAYCRVIALYPLNPAIVAQAKARADRLRSDSSVFVK